jgi:undecaprenyl-diphosphatase
VLPRLTRAADHSVLWFATAAACALAGRRGRRAALRGVASLTVASALANGPLKWSVRRARPALTHVPSLRQLPRQPWTTSFPSGHSASAAAFATGVALQWPLVGVPVAVTAGAVAYSRIYTGVHYPGDVAAGVGLGVASALVIRRVWPVPPDVRRGAPAEPVSAPALPDGAGFVLLVNADAGSAEPDEVRERVRDVLPAAEVVVVDPDDDVDRVLDAAAARATVLGVAGGDGTVSHAAAVALRHRVPLAVVPAGTLNHFAADLGVSDLDDTLAAVATGSAVAIDVGSAGSADDDLLFLNTFSLGVYPDLVRRRERWERWFGKWGALALALVSTLRSADPVQVTVGGDERRLWLLFGGNGRYHPPGFAPSWRERLDSAVVDVRMVDADRPLARLRLIAAVMSGRLGRCRVYEERTVDRLEVRLPSGQRMARDGEIHDAPRRLVLRPARRRLVVYRPADG